MATKSQLAKVAFILLGSIAGALALFRLVELLTPALGYDFALIVVSCSLPPIGLVGMLVEDAIR